MGKTVRFIGTDLDDLLWAGSEMMNNVVKGVHDVQGGEASKEGHIAYTRPRLIRLTLRLRSQVENRQAQGFPSAASVKLAAQSFLGWKTP